MNTIESHIAVRDAIPISLVTSQSIAAGANTCAYNAWYKFRKCTIRTCKNYTQQTESRCLAIDRQAPVGNKAITDNEIHLYKFATDDVSTRLVSLRRKKALLRVKCMLVLDAFITHIAEKYENTRQEERYFASENIDKTLARYPLKVKRLRFENWMWPHLVSKKEYRAFVSERKGECAQFGIHHLLDTTPAKLDILRKSIIRGEKFS